MLEMENTVMTMKTVFSGLINRLNIVRKESGKLK